MKRSIDQIKEAIRVDLKTSRFEHTMGVAYTAAALSMRYHSDLEDAFLAGLLHDCAKNLSIEESHALIESSGLTVSESERISPQLLHAKCGMILARDHFEVDNPDILHAILVHTTGCPDMSLLDKIIYIADYIEPGRKEAPRLGELRELAFSDLDRCLLEILRDTVKYLDKDPTKHMDPMTLKAYQYYNTSEKNAEI